MALWKNGAFAVDNWRYVSEGEEASPAGHVIMPIDWWQTMRDIFAQSNAPVGLRIEPDESIEEIAGDIPRFSLIALSFPKFTDGRAYSTAQFLRQRYGFAGELRAVGDLFVDQLPFMQRCGFDAFEIDDPITEAALNSGQMWQQRNFYQPAVADEAPAGTRPWLRKRRN